MLRLFMEMSLARNGLPVGFFDSLDLAGAANRVAETEKHGRLISSSSLSIHQQNLGATLGHLYLSSSVC
jgi:hypothetical protein